MLSRHNPQHPLLRALGGPPGLNIPLRNPYTLPALKKYILKAKGPNAQDPEHEPSKSIRDAILERLNQQRHCLVAESTRLEELVAAGDAGVEAASTGRKGKADEQFSGKESFMMTGHALFATDPDFRAMMFRVGEGVDSGVSDDMKKFIRLGKEVEMMVDRATNFGEVRGAMALGPYINGRAGHRRPKKTLDEEMEELIGP